MFLASVIPFKDKMDITLKRWDGIEVENNRG
jgi:hypothetical protein